MRIYAANLAPDVTEDDLRSAFAAFGQVTFVKIHHDPFNEVPPSSGMVGMPSKLEAKAAIAGLNGKNLKGKPLSVNEAGVLTH